MLTITTPPGDYVLIGEAKVWISYSDRGGNKIRLDIEAPREMKVLRQKTIENMEKQRELGNAQ